MEVKKPTVITVIVILALTLMTAGIMGYMWGEESGNNVILRQEKDRYEAGLAVRDSISEAKERRIVFLQDSFSRLVKDAVAINERADRRIIIIHEDEDKMRKETRSVPSLSNDSLVRLFNRLADSYEPQ